MNTPKTKQKGPYKLKGPSPPRSTDARHVSQAVGLSLPRYLGEHENAPKTTRKNSVTAWTERNILEIHRQTPYSSSTFMPTNLQNKSAPRRICKFGPRQIRRLCARSRICRIFRERARCTKQERRIKGKGVVRGHWSLLLSLVGGSSGVHLSSVKLLEGVGLGTRWVRRFHLSGK